MITKPRPIRQVVPQPTREDVRRHQALRPLRTATISLGNQQITPHPDHARALLDDLAEGGH
jgi:hypothetical protein